MNDGMCSACGIKKEMCVLEKYQYQNDGIVTDEPILPLLELDCQSNNGREFRRVSLCHVCFHKVLPDMWMSQRGWELLNPIIHFNDLPKLSDKEKTGMKIDFVETQSDIVYYDCMPGAIFLVFDGCGLNKVPCGGVRHSVPLHQLSPEMFLKLGEVMKGQSKDWIVTITKDKIGLHCGC